MISSLFQDCRLGRRQEGATASIMDMSHISNHTESVTGDSIIETFISAYMLIIPYITNLTESVINETNVHDDIRHVTSFIANHRIILFNGTTTELEVVGNSISRLSEYIVKHNKLMNATYTDGVATSFADMASFVLNHAESMGNSSQNEFIFMKHLISTLIRRRSRFVCNGPECIISIIGGVVGGIGIIGNVVAFNVFGMMGHENVIIVLLRALAMTDSTFLLLAIIHTTLCDLHRGCYVVSNLYFRPAFIAAQITTVWTSVLLGINRYIVVCRPFMASRWCTLNVARKQLVVVVFLALMYALPRFFEGEKDEQIVSFALNVSFSRETFVFKPWAKNYYYMIIYQDLLYMISLFVAPMLLQLILSIRLGATLYAARRERQEMGANVSNGDKYVTHLVFCVLIAFLICYTPVAINSMLWMAHGKITMGGNTFLHYFQPIALAFAVLNSSVNCMIYVTVNPTFRKTLTNMLFRRMATDIS